MTHILMVAGEHIWLQKTGKEYKSPDFSGTFIVDDRGLWRRDFGKTWQVQGDYRLVKLPTPGSSKASLLRQVVDHPGIRSKDLQYIGAGSNRLVHLNQLEEQGFIDIERLPGTRSSRNYSTYLGRLAAGLARHA